MELLEREFKGVRARLQRLKDLKFFHGWIAAVRPGEVRLRCHCGDAIELGEEFFGLLHGLSCSAHARLTVTEVQTPPGKPSDRRLIIFRLGPFQLFEAQELARKENNFITAAISPDVPGQLEVVNVSQGGLSIKLGRELAEGDPVQLELQSYFGDLTLKTEVRHCRPTKDEEGRFQAGLKIVEMPRLDAAVWKKLLAA